jgi:hypothetical protein
MVNTKIKQSSGSTHTHCVGEFECYDAALVPPPLNTKLFVISKYGVARIGTFDPNYDVAWFPLLRMPQTVKQRISDDKGL